MTKITLNAGNLVFGHKDVLATTLQICSSLRLVEDGIWSRMQARVAPFLITQIRLQTTLPVDAHLDLHGQLIWADENFAI